MTDAGAPRPGSVPAAAPPAPLTPDAAPPPCEEAPLDVTPEMLAPRRARPVDDGRREFEEGIGYAAPLTLALIVANVAVFAWELATGALQTGADIVAAGALQRDHVLAGETWRLVSSEFLHGSPDHLLGNMAALYILGLGLEHGLGARRFATVYVASMLAASAASLAMGPGPSVGASGAIFGVMGALVAHLYRHRADLVVRERRIPVVLGLWAGWTLLVGAVVPMIDNAAHVGGLAMGAALGWRSRARS